MDKLTKFGLDYKFQPERKKLQNIEKKVEKESVDFYEKNKHLIPEIKKDLALELEKDPEKNQLLFTLHHLGMYLVESEKDDTYRYTTGTINRISDILLQQYRPDSLMNKPFSPQERLLIADLVDQERMRAVMVEFTSVVASKEYIKSYRIIEVFAYLGISSEMFEQIKKNILDNGDMCLLNKLSTEFNYKPSQEEVLILANKALLEDSAYDLNEAIKIVPGIGPKFIERRNFLIERAKNIYELNKRKILEGVKNKNFFTHFCPTTQLDSIMKYGILSIMEQRKLFAQEKMGEGPDLQQILGSLDCISIFNLYKGADSYRESRKYDEDIYSHLKNQIQQLAKDFQNSKKERFFNMIGRTMGAETLNITTREEQELYRQKFSRLIESNEYFDIYINPHELNPLSMEKLQIGKKDPYKGDMRRTIVHSDGKIQFPSNFFDDIDTNNDKAQLFENIKKLRNEAYVQSLSHKDLSVTKESLHKMFKINDKKGTSINFILDPTLSATFTMSVYSLESFVEDKVTPDKILGAIIVDDYVKKYCFNNGIVGFDVQELTQPNSQNNDTLLIEHDRIIKTVPIYD